MILIRAVLGRNVRQILETYAVMEAIFFWGLFRPSRIVRPASSPHRPVPHRPRVPHRPTLPSQVARETLAKDYAGIGETIQFRPNSTYENFVGGHAPVQESADGHGTLGFRFAPKPGFLMDAVASSPARTRRRITCFTSTKSIGQMLPNHRRSQLRSTGVRLNFAIVERCGKDIHGSKLILTVPTDEPFFCANARQRPYSLVFGKTTGSRQSYTAAVGKAPFRG